MSEAERLAREPTYYGVVLVCRTEAGEFVSMDVGGECPICRAVVEQLVAPLAPPSGLHPHGKVLNPVAQCPNGHLLERVELETQPARGLSAAP